MSEFFDALKEGLEEAISHKKGKATLRSNTIELPSPPHQYTARDIKKIRKKLNYSQAIFAMVLNVSTKTVQSWEAGERTPSGASLRLLEIVDFGNFSAQDKNKHAPQKKKTRASKTA